VGESGCGKTTTGRAMIGRVKLTKGRLFAGERDVTSLSKRQWRRLRRDIQLIFQDPYASLNPRMRVRDIIAEPIVVNHVARGAELDRRVADLLDLVRLPASAADRYPHAFSGGQRQRIVIARALALHPKFVVADEPVSALDVSIQAQIVSLLQDLQRELGLSYLFIAHNLAVVRHIADRVAVMYLGRLVELADKDVLYENALHPYTRALLSAVPIPDPTIERLGRIILRGDVPSPMAPPEGCRFNTRCPYAEERCFHDIPPLTEVEPGHRVACWVAIDDPLRIKGDTR
jgi:oligopeptide transport system ATP-binding protein